MSSPSKPQKQDITLMTLLANEATAEAKGLLKQYNREPAKNYEDLEVKLAELYYSVPDKIRIERELANIHPHKEWIIKNVITETDSNKETKPKENDIDFQLNKVQKEIINISSPEEKSSYVGQETTKQPPVPFKVSDYMGLLAVAGLIGVTFYTLTRHK